MPKPTRRERKRRGIGRNPKPAAQPVRDAARLEAASLIKAGSVKFDDGGYDGAIADYEQAIEVDRGIALAYRNREKIAAAYFVGGIAKSEQGDYDGTIADRLLQEFQFLR